MSLLWIWFCACVGAVIAKGQDAFDACYYMGAVLFIVWLRDRWGFGGGPKRYDT